MNKVVVLTCCAFLLFSNTVYAQTKTINLVIPAPAKGLKVRNPFIEDLLTLIFNKQGKSLTIEYYERYLPQGRSLKEISSSNEIDLTWSATSLERERQLLPVRIPIYQGLIGWRVFLIRQGEQEKFSQITNLSQLSSLVGVQRFDWPDYKVLKENELDVEGNLSFENLSLAINDGIADYYPRSVLEIVRELSFDINKGLVIEQDLILKYPAAYYFFVNRNNLALATEIEAGFEQAIVDGSYMALFQRHFGEALKQLKLEERTILKLTNSQFPEMSEAVKSKYWYQQ